MSASTAVLNRIQYSYLGLVQFLFLLTWVVYVIFLGDLVEKLGLPKDFVPRLLLIDQLLFVCADLALALYADRLMRLLRSLAPVLISLNLLSCLAFVALPHLATGAPAVFIGATIVWVLTASVLRAPLYGLIARRGGEPGRAMAGALLGMGLASAFAPYLGVILKGVDPVLPFTIAGVGLALATLGFFSWEARQLPAKSIDCSLKPAWGVISRLALMVLLLGLAFQLHFFVNAAPLYKTVADAAWLPWLMPVFWVAFSLIVYPGALAVTRYGARRIFALSAILGALASAACLSEPSLPVLLVLQLLAGAAWGGIFIAALNLAGSAGNSGRESLFIGALFASLALAAATRIGLSLADISLTPQLTLPLAAGLWLAGAFLSLSWLKTPSLPQSIDQGEIR